LSGCSVENPARGREEERREFAEKNKIAIKQ
jgi:hypothetical protein